jgi:hypothetical protein
MSVPYTNIWGVQFQNVVNATNLPVPSGTALAPSGDQTTWSQPAHATPFVSTATASQPPITSSAPITYTPTNYSFVPHASLALGFTGDIPITLFDDRVAKTEYKFFPIFTDASGGGGGGGAQGATGDRGATGERGETGAKGATGERGETGAQGNTGAKGETGAKGNTGGVRNQLTYVFNRLTNIALSGTANIAQNVNLFNGTQGTDWVVVLNNGFTQTAPNQVQYTDVSGRWFMIHTSVAFLASGTTNWALELQRNGTGISQARYSNNSSVPLDCQDFNILQLATGDILTWRYSGGTITGTFNSASQLGMTTSTTKPFQLIIWEILVPT